MSKSNQNHRQRIRRAKKNHKISLTKAIAVVLEHIQKMTPEGFSQVVVAQRNQKIRFAKKAHGTTAEVETIVQHMYVFTKKITEQRLVVLGETVSARVNQYLELERLIPVTPGHQATLYRQQKEQILPELCKDWQEYKALFKTASGGADVPFGADIWLNDHCTRAAANPAVN